jgi:uncharacterized protein (TIGR03435 family)
MTMLWDSLSDLAVSLGPSILVKSTLALLITLGALRLARDTRASLRHLLLVAGFGVLLALPIAITFAPSVRVEVTPVPLFEDYLSEAVSLDNQAPIALTPLQSSVSNPADWWNVTTPELMTALWLGGVVLFGTPLVVGTLQVRRLRRTGLPWRAGQRLVDSLTQGTGIRRPVDVLLHESIAAPATCGIGRHAVLFPIDADTWQDEDTLRAAVHEVEHVRRCDCLVNVVVRAICAVYWFHPLVWIAWRRLALEAERACDDAVLRRAAADAYAEQLVTLAGRLSASARHPLLAMANRSDLVERVKAVLDRRQARGRAGAAASVTIAIAAGALIATLSPLHAVNSSSGVIERAEPLSVDQRVAGPAAQAPQQPLPAFEVASIRRNTVGFAPDVSRVEGGRYTASNMTLAQLVRDAYRMPVAGGPEWINDPPGPPRSGEIRFDVIATLPPGTAPDRVPLMLRTLLAERFNLVVHTETQAQPAYALVHARDDRRPGPELTPSTQQCQSEIEAGPLRAPVRRVTEDGKPVCSMMVGPAAIRGGGLTMKFLANALRGPAGRIVVDRTGLEGPFDFSVTWAAQGRGGARPPASDDRPSIFVAVQEQLGLKLEPSVEPVEVLVIDQVSMPTEN